MEGAQAIKEYNKGWIRAFPDARIEVKNIIVSADETSRLDLTLEDIGEVERGSGGDMAVRPRNVLPCWCAGGIKETGLGEQNERPIGVAAMTHRIFGRGDFLEAAAKMHGGRPRAVRRVPRNGAVQRVIDFEDPRAVTVLGKPARESRGETVARDAQ